MHSEADQLRDEVYGCELCTEVGAFRRPANERPFFKFPPIIGAQGKVDLLFIGINPRRSPSNFELHDWVMKSRVTFAEIAQNTQKDGSPYIRADSDEEHYQCHVIVVESLFGVNTAFETKAAVTELMYCASRNEPLLLSRLKSPCAALYLQRVLQIVKPQVVIAVGSGVWRHLEKHFKQEIAIPVVRMEHPGPLYGMSRAVKARRMQPTIDDVRKVLML